MNPTRALFWLAALFNFLVAAGLLWKGSPGWALLGLEYPAQPVFLNLFAAFVALFGAAYFWIGLDPAGKRPLILLGAAGKGLMVVAITAHWLAGIVPVAPVVLSLGDLVFAVLFLRAASRVPQ